MIACTTTGDCRGRRRCDGRGCQIRRSIRSRSGSGSGCSGSGTRGGRGTITDITGCTIVAMSRLGRGTSIIGEGDTVM